MVFHYKPMARIKTPAQVAGEVCWALESNGGLTPKRLLDASRDKDAPLHGEFTWDDATAAEAYRESQAAYIIRMIVVEQDRKDQSSVRAFINVSDNPREYRSLETVINTPSLRDLMLKQALSEMLAFSTKYKQLTELVCVVEEMEKVLAGAKTGATASVARRPLR